MITISDSFGNNVNVSHFGISTGDKSGYYTLKAYGTRSRYVRDDHGNTSTECDDAQVYIRNLSTDKEKALEAAREYLAKHYPTAKFSGVVNFDLDEIHRISREQAEAQRAAEAARVAATDFSKFQGGKYAGKYVVEVYSEDKSYLEWFACQSYREGTDSARTQVFAKALLAPEQEAAEALKETKVQALKAVIGSDTLAAWYRGEGGGFLQSISSSLNAGGFPQGRGLSIVLEILAKWAGRTGSKAYNARLQKLQAQFA